ncbi:hypothetical protein PV326_007444, partial [Microctonus aethiopoides]
ECLYHHPVHKISFIAQDMSDSRAFGYIFGSPDTGHRFFGIKTDKAANQVVIAMRDLFQVVFELKKKEIELAKQHIEQNAMKFPTSSIFVEPAPDTKGAAGSESCLLHTRSSNSEIEKITDKKLDNKSGVIADLLDLQFELNSLQQGIHQMDKITPENARPSSEDPFETDPFGDSFTNIKVKGPVQPMLPPPPSSTKRGHLERQQTVPTPSSQTSSPATVMPSRTSPPAQQTPMRWLENDVEKQFCDGEIANLTSTASADKDAKSDNDSTSSFRIQGKSPQIDVFTELDPLGTGLSKPYIDKKDFFQHLKNPPKKVLKDLVTTSSGDTFPTNFDLSIDSLDPINNSNEKSSSIFEDGDFADFDKFEVSSDIQNISSNKRSPQLAKKSKIIHHQPLSVSLPPEECLTLTKNIPTTSIGRVERDNSEAIQSLIRLPSPNKQQSVRKKEFDIDLSSSSSCREQSVDKPFPVDFSVVNDSPASPMRSGSSEANSRLSSSSAELEIVPEPPPRGAGSIVINPPPLPPKKQNNRGGYKPPPRPPHNDGHFNYDFIGRQTSTPSPTKKDQSIKSPEYNPIRRFDDDFTPICKAHESTSRIDTVNSLSSSRFEDSFSNMIPTTLSSLLFKNTYDSAGKVKKKASLDITLSQLTSSNLHELAKNLNMTVNELTNLTLQQLTECLSKLSTEDTQPTPPSSQPSKNNMPETTFVSDEPLFKANFEQSTKTNEDSTYDKYAVFRELLVMEQVKEDQLKDSIDNDINDFDRKESSSQDDEVYDIDMKIKLNIKPDDESMSDINGINVMNKSISEEAIEDDMKEENVIGIITDTVNLQSINHNQKIVTKLSDEDSVGKCDSPKELNIDIDSQLNQGENTYEIKEEMNVKSSPKAEIKSPSKQSNDRYAALREIVADVEHLNNEPDDKPITPTSSPIEPPKPTVAEQDLMKLFSAPQSQTSSPKKLNQNNSADLKAIATDIFKEIRMLNTDIDNARLDIFANPRISGFEDVFCPFTETNKQTNKEEIKDENWAKFDTGIFHSDKSSYEGHGGSIGGTSPWSPDEKEIHKESTFKTTSTAAAPTTIITANRHSGDSDNEWKDEEESEESNGRLRDERFWTARHPRFDSSCEDSIYYDDGTMMTEKERHFRERTSKKSRGISWTKARMRPESPPWHEEDRWDEENRRYSTRKIPYKDDDERKAHWKCRGGSGGGGGSQRPHWNGDRDGFRSHDHPMYDDERGKRRMMLWNEDDRDRDRFSSQESMGYDDEERWSRREYERRRWEEDGRFWGRRGAPPPPDGDYPASYRKHNAHYRRDSRERPSLDYPPGWEDDYGIDRGVENSHRYIPRKRHWPKRPNSANDERNVEVAYSESRVKYGVSRSECSDNDSELYHRPYRSRSREIYWESDQEFDSWGERPYWSEGPDTKNENLHRRRMNRHKQLMRAPVIKPQNSPFEDDFTQSLELNQPSMDSMSTETRIRSQDISEIKQEITSRSNVQELAQKDKRKYKGSSYFDDDLTPTQSASSDTSDRQRLSSDLKATPDDLPCDTKDPASADGFISEDSGRDSFFNGDPRFDDDAFAFKSEMADSVPDTTTGMTLKNSRQLKYGNNKIKSGGDHDIKKSESVNIFVRESDPFDDDDFFN